MDTFCFCTKHDEVEVDHLERKKINHLIRSIAIAPLRRYISLDISKGSLWHVLPWDSELRQIRHWKDFEPMFESWMHDKSGQNYFEIEGDKIPVSSIVFNTASLVGCDIIKLLCRLHAYCEGNCFIEPENKSWFFATIAKGIRDSIISEKYWFEVCELLDKSDDDTVVLSPTSNGFPNSYWVTHCDQEEIIDQWNNDQLNHEEKWNYCLNGLRTHNRKREISPVNFSYYYGTTLNAFDIINYFEQPKDQYEQLETNAK